jgi:hypothetical protein
MNKVICIINEDYPVSLELGKEYDVLENHPKGLLQIRDETNEVYYYDKNLFSEMPKDHQQ